MLRLGGALALFSLPALSVAWAPPVPTAEQLAWQEAEVGCMISFGITTSVGEQGCGESGVPPPLPSAFEPAALNVTGWVEAAKLFGAKYCVLTAQHSCGFALWPSNVSLADGSFSYNFTVAQTGPNWPRRDIVADYVAACRATGVKPGLYYPTTRNAYLDVSGSVVQNSTLRPPQRRVTQEQFDEIMLAQLAELWGAYRGELYELWFDGGHNAALTGNISAIVGRLQPQAMAFGGYTISPNPVRWVGTESGDAPVPCWSTGPVSGGGSPVSDVWNPAESDTTLAENDQWFYNPDVALRSLEELVAVYHATVGRNTNLLLNLAPRPDGTVDPAAVARYRELGDWVGSCYGAAVASVSSNGTYATELAIGGLGQGAAVDRFVVREDQSRGQLVRQYEIDAEVGGEWVQVANGTSVGNRAIVILPAAVTATAARLVVVASAGPKGGAVVSQFAAYDCSGMSQF